MASVKIADIIVEGRMRKDLGDIEGLAASMSKVGLIEPIVLHQGTNVLICGGRRLEAAKHLQWDEVDCVYKENLSDVEAQEIELEENLRRKELDWVEEVLGIEKLFKTRQAKYGEKTGRKNWSLEGDGYGVNEAAHDLERTSSSVSMDLTLARGLREYPQLAEEKTKSAAFKRYRVLRETALRTEAARRSRESGPQTHKTFDDYQAEHTDGQEIPRQVIYKTIFKESRSVLYHADCLDVLKYLAEHHVQVDCIVTDPPFGLGLHKEGSSFSGSRLGENTGEMYDDDPHAIMDMLDQAFMWMGRILKNDGHAYIFFHHTRYEETFKMLRNHFGTCEETPIIWIKNTPGIGDPNRTWVYAYEPCFMVNRGRLLVTPQAFNYLKFDTVPPGQKIHPTEKPTALLRHIVNASCVPGEVVLDPFTGSGSTLVGAHQVGCRFIGIEKMESFYRKTLDRLAEELAENPQTKAGEKENRWQTESRKEQAP